MGDVSFTESSSLGCSGAIQRPNWRKARMIRREAASQMNRVDIRTPVLWGVEGSGGIGPSRSSSSAFKRVYSCVDMV